MLLQDSNIKTSCKKNSRNEKNIYQTNNKQGKSRKRQPNSSDKKYKCTDVKL